MLKVPEEDGITLVGFDINKAKLVPRAAFPVLRGAMTGQLVPGGGIRLVEVLLGLFRYIGAEGHVIPGIM